MVLSEICYTEYGACVMATYYSARDKGHTNGDQMTYTFL